MIKCPSSRATAARQAETVIGPVPTILGINSTGTVTMGRHRSSSSTSRSNTTRASISNNRLAPTTELPDM
jgi:hypothetical protein